MGQIAMELSPPRWWQDFQELTLDLSRYLWPDIKAADVVGRDGQSQNGVDVFVQRQNEVIGIQCKRRARKKGESKLMAGGEISKKELDALIDDAEAFGDLNQFVVATTVLPDENLQAYVREVNRTRQAAGEFTVEVWFWTRFQTEIGLRPELLYRHYELVLKSNQNYDPVLHYLTVLRTAFTRPAFDTPFTNEGRDTDFLQALTDTQTAMTTGILVDREVPNRIIDRAPVELMRVEPTALRESLLKIREVLQTIRDRVVQGMGEGRIRQTDVGINADPGISDELDKLRADAISKINNLLAKAKLTKVESRLLKGG